MCTSAALAGSAQKAEYAHLLDVFQKTCVAAFPDFSKIQDELVSLGFEPTSDGNWVSEQVFVKAQNGDGNETVPFCHANLRLKSSTRELSDAAQAALVSMGVHVIRAQRKGVRLTAELEKSGVLGELFTDSLGPTSIIVIRGKR
ncbi:MAG: hypothetical protein BM560_10735 [Roseobacter sp. MedPE-SWde]|nr:hypothetical protein MED193_10548 [Roseobacter sp. MED193]OIQ41113.1 MAG: hypothetical protein BM560_10735 [Roseobacter sp. MedPE-SWde]